MQISPFYLINTVAFLQQRYMLPIVFLFYLHNGLTVEDFIFFQSIFYLISLLAEIPAGYLADIFSRKKIMIISSFLYIFRLILWICCGGYWGLLIGEIFFGFSKSFVHGIADSYIFDCLNAQNKTKQMLHNFGRYNFYLCLASAVGGIIGAFIYKVFDSFTLLLMIELILNIAAIIFIFLLPDIAYSKINKHQSFFAHARILATAVKTTISNRNINLFIIYSAILAGTSNLFAWNFQPIMKSLHLSIILFGILHFINHTLRGTFSFFSQTIIRKISYKNLGVLTAVLHSISFVILCLNQLFSDQIMGFISLVIICVAIGFQVTYYCATTARLHDFVLPVQHATSSSVLAMCVTLCSSIFLYAFKEISAIAGGATTFLLFLLFFVTFAFFCNYKVKK